MSIPDPHLRSPSGRPRARGVGLPLPGRPGRSTPSPRCRAWAWDWSPCPAGHTPRSASALSTTPPCPAGGGALSRPGAAASGRSTARVWPNGYDDRAAMREGGVSHSSAGDPSPLAG